MKNRDHEIIQFIRDNGGVYRCANRLARHLGRWYPNIHRAINRAERAGTVTVERPGAPQPNVIRVVVP